MLWSWVVGRIGGLNGEWRHDVQGTQAWQELARNESVTRVTNPVLDIRRAKRITLRKGAVNEALGVQEPLATEYIFCKYLTVLHVELPLSIVLCISLIRWISVPVTRGDEAISSVYWRVTSEESWKELFDHVREMLSR